MILRHNAEWIVESPDNYATHKRSLPESKTERIYVDDNDYRCDPWAEPTIYNANPLAFKYKSQIHRNIQKW